MSGIAANPRFLINLKELLDGGHITEEEYVEQRRSLLAPTTTTSSTLETTLAVLASTQVELLRFLTSGTVRAPERPQGSQGAPPVTPTSGVSSATLESSAKRSRPTLPPCVRSQGQKTLFDVGVVDVGTPSSTTAKRQRITLLSGKFKCPAVGCSKVFDKPGPLAMHKKHKHPDLEFGAQSVASLFLHSMSSEQRAKEDERLKARAIDVEVSFLVRDMVNKVANEAMRHMTASELRSMRAEVYRARDRRKNNKGAPRRKARSIGFKAKVPCPLVVASPHLSSFAGDSRV